MNRRGFISSMLKAAAGFTILPPATTYARIWRAERPPIEPVVLQYRANTTGIYDQLKACGEMVPSSEPFEMDDLIKMLYAIKKEREMNRALSDTIFFDVPISI